MDYLERLKKEVDHIAELCDQSVALQKKLSAAIDRLESLELENQGFLASTLQELRDFDRVDYKDARDFIRQTGPYLPQNWSGFSDPRAQTGQISGRLGAKRRWDKTLGFPDGYELLLNCLVAAFHIDPNTVELHVECGVGEAKELRMLLGIDLARDNLELPLPLPNEVVGVGYYEKVRRLLKCAIKSRHELNQQIAFINAFTSHCRLNELLGAQALEKIGCEYAKSNQFDGYVDLRQSSLDMVKDSLVSKPELLLSKFGVLEVREFIAYLKDSLEGISTPSSREVTRLVDDHATDKALRGLLQDGYRTTDDWYRRKPR